MKKLFLLLLITLLAFTNVRAETFDPPVEVGDTYQFTLTYDSNCTGSETAAAEGEEVRKFEQAYDWTITSVDLEAKQFDADFTLTKDLHISDGTVFDFNTTMTYYYPNLLSEFIPDISLASDTNSYYYATPNIFIEPDFETINSNTGLLLDEYTNILFQADSLEFMGETSLEDGIEKLKPSTRMWTISAIFDTFLSGSFENIKIGMELEYGKDGIVEYSKTTRLSKRKESEDTCFIKTEYKNTTSFFSFLPGFEIYFPIILIPVIFLRKFKR